MSEHCAAIDEIGNRCRWLVDHNGKHQYYKKPPDYKAKYLEALEAIRRLREAVEWQDTAVDGKMPCYCKVPPVGEDGVEAHDEACAITRAAMILTQGYSQSLG